MVTYLIFLDDAVLMFSRRRIPGDTDGCAVLIAHREDRHLLRRSTRRWDTERETEAEFYFHGFQDVLLHYWHFGLFQKNRFEATDASECLARIYVHRSTLMPWHSLILFPPKESVVSHSISIKHSMCALRFKKQDRWPRVHKFIRWGFSSAWHWRFFAFHYDFISCLWKEGFTQKNTFTERQ